MGGITAEAEVVRGGNRRVEIRVPVYAKGARGTIWWEGEAVATLDIPADATLPDVHVDTNTGPRVEEVPRA